MQNSAQSAGVPQHVVASLAEYHRRGWAVVALHHIRADGTCSCGNPKGQAEHDYRQGGKHPLVADWTSRGLTSWPDIWATWEASPAANIGIVTGRPSGVFVLDFDPANADLEACAALLDALPPPTVETGGGGWHWYFTMPADFEPTNSSGRLPAGFDLRGTGGQVVAPPSISGKGAYQPYPGGGVYAPAAWLLDAIRPAPKVVKIEVARAIPTNLVGNPHPYAVAGVRDELAALAAAPDGRRNSTGHTVACNLRELLNSLWTGLQPWEGHLRADFIATMVALPGDHPVPESEAADLWDVKAPRTVGDKQRPAPPPLVVESTILMGDLPRVPFVNEQEQQPQLPELDVTNESDAARWLVQEMGRGSLSGVFARGEAGQLVFTPAIGERGYRTPPDARDDDGPAQVRPVDAREVAARVHSAWRTFRWRKATEADGTDEQLVQRDTLFPMEAARTALAVPDQMPNVRRLRGVVHAPMIRRDGSVLETPGYDVASRTLYLPQPGLHVPPVAEAPTPAEIAGARALIDYFIGEFPFVGDGDRAAYIALLLTPLLRDICPPPYKMVVVTAHQPGSGKTLLATIARTIHGGVMRSEMPEDDAELRKQITTILSTTTGPVVHIDNVSGRLTSSTLSGLLTSDAWDDRRLGANELARCVNDRIWTLTGNNVAIGDDLARRTAWVSIDPGVPNPEHRVGFRIPDPAGWAKEHRGIVLHALLTLIRAWVAAGRPGVATSSDSYAEWNRAVNGILSVAGWPAKFDLPADRPARESADDTEWAEWLAALELRFGRNPFTAREALEAVATHTTLIGGIIGGGQTIPSDMLPTELADKFLRAPMGQGPMLLAKPLGWWFRNRQGRWAGRRTVRAIPNPSKQSGSKWVIERAPGFSE